MVKGPGRAGRHPFTEQGRYENGGRHGNRQHIIGQFCLGDAEKDEDNRDPADQKLYFFPLASLFF